MQEFEITAPDGRVVTVTGDRMPTAADLDQIFAALPKAEPEKRSMASGVAHAVANGYFAGLGDELSAGADALSQVGPRKFDWTNNIQEAQQKQADWKEKFNTAYEPALDKERTLQKQFEKDHPVSAIAGNVSGALLNPMMRAMPTSNKTILGFQTPVKALLGAGTGAVYGGLYGFGEGEGGFENRLANAGKRAKIGAIVGGSIPVAVEGVKAVGRGIADVAGQTSGAGGESLKRGFDAGTRNSKTFTDAMRGGKSSVYDVVDDVDKAVRTMERNASAKYKAMLPDNGATLKLPDTEFKKALNEATKSISGVTSGVDDTAANAINKVHKLAQNIKVNGGMTFNNALEAKKAIDGIIEPLSRAGEKNAVRLLTPIKNALNSTLESAVPEYNGARAAFRADSRLIDSIKSALTSKDPTTELRKLQGITRQSVAAAQGGKQELGRVLDAVSGGKILDAIAGGQVQQWIPRDPVRAGGAVATALSTHALSANPLGIASTLAFSPRISGELAFALGRIASKTPQANTNAILRIVDALQKR